MKVERYETTSWALNTFSNDLRIIKRAGDEVMRLSARDAMEWHVYGSLKTIWRFLIVLLGWFVRAYSRVSVDIRGLRVVFIDPRYKWSIYSG